jgi:3-hydroxyacyl-CoA dehydrogenase/enoyl-CoA hydratase/3-hydroxybutyryl-CoA epimerase
VGFEKIDYKSEDQIVYIGLGKSSESSLTTLTIQSLEELNLAFEQVEGEISRKNCIGVIIYSLNPGCFLAGMDINVISSLNTPGEAAKGAEKGQYLFNRLEDLKVPKVVCVDGVCLGGGLEMALACDYILASDSPKTRLGLPEVMLGFIPGFGGTYRLPKKVALPAALDIILSGRPVDSRKGKKLGLVSEVYPAERLVEMAKKWIINPDVKKESFSENLQHLAVDNFVSRKVIFQKARESVLKKTKGFYQAPLKIIEVMESGSWKSRKSYLSAESNAFGELSQSEQSQALQHIYFLNEKAKKMFRENGKAEPIKIGGVLGAGTMGGGIAWLFADNNQRPYMKDIRKEALEIGLKQSSDNFKKALKKRKLDQDGFERKQRSITPTLTFEGFHKVDLVVEAVVEKMEVKKSVFAELEKQVSKSCLLTSNTSSLSVEEMSTALEDPSRFAGLHFFNPVHRMPLVEIVTHSKISDQTVERLYQWALKVKKTPIVVKDCPGFLVNRILVPWLNESMYLLQEGVSMSDVDQAALNFGMPMGPCRLMDEIGLDVMEKVGGIIYEGLGERLKPSELSQKIVETGLLGKKGGKGFYNYDSSGQVTSEGEEILALHSGSRKKMDEVEIQMRMFLPMINEASHILNEGITDDPGTVDLGLIFGIGFPPFRGGLLRYADSEGIERIGTALKEFSTKVNSHRYETSSFIESMIANKKKFYDFSKN